MKVKTKVKPKEKEPKLMDKRPKEVFKTFPLADDYKHEPNSNEAIPSPDDVKEAKDWVDFNEK